MEARYGLAQRIWVMDRGMTSAENVAWLQRTGRRYLIGTARSELRKWSRELAEARDWQVVRDGVEVKICGGPDGQEHFLLCRSRERREKERAMHTRFATRIDEGLERLAKRLAGARRPLTRVLLERQIGRLLERNARAAGRYTIDLVETPDTPAGLRLVWTVRPEWEDWARHSEGAYILRTNIPDWSPDSLWGRVGQVVENI